MRMLPRRQYVVSSLVFLQRTPTRPATPKRVLPIITVGALVALAILAFSLALSNSHAARDHAARDPVNRTAVNAPLHRRWYAASSLWNTPISADPRIAPNSSTLVAAWANVAACGGAPCLDPAGQSYTPAVYYA